MQNKNTFGIIFLIVVIAALGLWYTRVFKPSHGSEVVACTMEAKMCPDGSSVGRVGPKCEFAACPTGTTNPGGGSQVVCTQDAKLCTDGSYVGRVPPSCSFAPCPGDSGETDAVFTVKLNESGTGLGVTIKPTAVASDSRCPTDVVCIQAGTVSLRALVLNNGASATHIFNLNVPMKIGAKTVELVQVTPAPNSKRTIAQGDYRFTFNVTTLSNN